MQDFKKTVLRDARLIVGFPENYINDPSQFTTAWAAMKAGRGQGFDPARLHPQHLIETPAPTPEPTERTLVRVSQRVRALISEKNIPVSRNDAA